MASFDTSAVGKVDDVVRLQLGSEDVMICESYEVHVGVLQQPAAFSLRLGKGDTILDVIRSSPPRTPFALYVGGVPQFTGYTDGYEAEGSTGATELTVTGRDMSGELHVGEFQEETTFTNSTYKQLAQGMLNLIDLPNAAIFLDNEANRKVRSGVGVVTISVPTPDPDVISDPTSGTGAPNTIIRTKVGETYMKFLRRHLDRAGICFWAAAGTPGAAASWAGAQGAFCLSVPNVNQQPTYQFVRRRGLPSNQVNILSAHWHVNTVGRFTTCEVHGRNGGKKSGRAKFSGAYVDDEMFNVPPGGYGYVRADGVTPLRWHSYRDANVTDVDQARQYARRKASEARRAGWTLSYEIAGHTCKSLVGGDRAVITPDTIAMVQDDELGLHGNFYVENVRYKRSGGGTTTTVNLIRTSDLIFGDSNDFGPDI